MAQGAAEGRREPRARDRGRRLDDGAYRAGTAFPEGGRPLCRVKY